MDATEGAVDATEGAVDATEGAVDTIVAGTVVAETTGVDTAAAQEDMTVDVTQMTAAVIHVAVLLPEK